MISDDLYPRYQELQQYVGWTDEDAVRVRSVAALRELRLINVDAVVVEIPGTKV